MTAIDACIPEDRREFVKEELEDQKKEIWPFFVIFRPETRRRQGRSGHCRQGLIFSLGTLLLGAVIASLATWNLKPAPPPPVSRFTVTLPPGQQLAGLENGPACYSPKLALPRSGLTRTLH